MQIYKPAKMALYLLKKNMLSPVHYYILTTLNNVSVSYQSSVLLELLQIDIVYSRNYRKLIQLVETEKFLRHIYSMRSDIG